MRRLRMLFGSRFLSVAIAANIVAMLAVWSALPSSASSHGESQLFRLLQRSIENREPALGPLSDQIDVTSDNPTTTDVDLSPRDFAIRLDCTVIIEPPNGTADCGLVFRRDQSGSALLFDILTDGSWVFGVIDGSPLQSGDPGAITHEWTQPARIELFAIGSIGYVGVNGAYLATLDLSAQAEPGGLSIGTGFVAEGESADWQVEYRNLRVWNFGESEATPPLDGEPLDPSTQFFQALDTTYATDPLGDPRDGALAHIEGQVAFDRAGVQLTDLAVHLACRAPGNVTGVWDCGIAFRLAETIDDQFRLIVLSDGRWILAKGTDLTLQNGTFEPSSTTNENELVIDLLAIGPTGWLGVNGDFISTLDLSLLIAPGDVAAGSSFFSSTYVAGGETAYQDFAVWEADISSPGLSFATPVSNANTGSAALNSDALLFDILIEPATAGPPAYGPTAGEMLHDPATITLVSSALDLQDLAARLHCITPPGADSRLWDCGIVWRSTGPYQQLRIVVVSDGFWSFRAGSGAVIAEGSGLAINNTPGTITSLDIIAVGDSGFFAVNRNFVARLDLSTVHGSGDVLAGTAFFNETFAEGQSTGYELFSIWSIAELLDEQPQPAGTALASPATAENDQDQSAAPLATPERAESSPVATPTGTSGLNDLSAMSAEESPALGTANIRPTGDSAIQGYGVVIRVARSIDVAVLVANAQQGDVVVIQPGACDQLDGDDTGIERVGVLNEQGIITTTLPIRLTEIINLGPHVMVVYASSDRSLAEPLACGTIES